MVFPQSFHACCVVPVRARLPKISFTKDWAVGVAIDNAGQFRVRRSPVPSLLIQPRRCTTMSEQPESSCLRCLDTNNSRTAVRTGPRPTDRLCSAPLLALLCNSALPHPVRLDHGSPYWNDPPAVLCDRPQEVFRETLRLMILLLLVDSLNMAPKWHWWERWVDHVTIQARSGHNTTQLDSLAAPAPQAMRRAC